MIGLGYNSVLKHSFNVLIAMGAKQHKNNLAYPPSQPLKA